MEHHIPFQSTRQFQIWRYTVSHRQLLLRSTKTEERSSRIDLLFKNIEMLSLPTTLNGIGIELGGPSDVSTARLKVPQTMKVYRIISQDVWGFVVASAFAVAEDEGEYFEPSKLISENFF